MTWQNPQPPTQQQWQQPPHGHLMYAMPIARPHSGFGIVSFILGLLAGLACVAAIVVAGVQEVRSPGSMNRPGSVEAIAVGLTMIGGILLALLGLVFAIVGLVNRQVAKTFSILGLIFNGLVIAIVAGLVIFGSMI